MAEALNGTFKAEIFAVFGGFETRAAAEIATYEWISYGLRFRDRPGNETPVGDGDEPT